MSFTSGTFCSCPFVLCSQGIRSLLDSLGSISALYPSFCGQISLMFYISPQLHCVTCFMDFPAVVVGSHGSFTGNLPAVPVIMSWCREACVEAYSSQVPVHSVQSLKALVLTLGDILRKLIAHHKAYFFFLFWPDKVLIIFKTFSLHLVAYVVVRITGSTEQKSSFSVLVFSLALTTDVYFTF